MWAKRVKSLALIWLTCACGGWVRAADVPEEGFTALPDATAKPRQTSFARTMAEAHFSSVIAEAAQKRPTDSPLREPSLAQAIGRAGKQGIVERSVEAYTEVLIQCQQNRSPILTVPFQRSDSQQSHCYRF